MSWVPLLACRFAIVLRVQAGSGPEPQTCGLADERGVPSRARESCACSGQVWMCLGDWGGNDADAQCNDSRDHTGKELGKI